jgi:hypothetical protein
MSKSALTATDWRAIPRNDGSIFLECGSPVKGYHMAFDVAIEDIDLARRFVAAMNLYNQGVD